MAKTRKVVVRRKAKTNRAKKNETTRLGAALRALGGLGGGALGSFIGQQGAGAGYGTQLGAGLSKWLGSGDYQVSSNSIMDQSPTGTIPSMHKDGQTIVVRHKEFIGEVRGSTAYTVQNILNINPGLFETFPWLSTVASKFQEYKIKGMVFHYVPSSGTAISSTSAALGTVMLQTSYRAGESPPTNKQELLNEYWSTEGRPSDAIVHPIECDPKENPYNLHYVRSGALPSGQDQLLYDLGSTYVATSGMQADGQLLGDLWVTYEIELKKPVMVSSVADVNKAFAASCSGLINQTTIFGSAPVYGNGNLGITLTTNGMIIPKTATGFFSIFINIVPNSGFSVSSIPASFPLTNCIAVQGNSNSDTVAGSSMALGTQNLSRAFICYTVYKPDTSSTATVTFSGITLTGAFNATYIQVFNRASPLW